MKCFKTCELLIMASILMTGCDNYYQMNPKVSFTQSFPKRSKNLTNVLGSHVALVLDRDTENIDIAFNKQTKINTLTNAITGDTLLQGKVSRYRGLYFFSEGLKDGTFWIYAVRISENEITGLGSSLLQMNTLQSEIEKGRYADLVAVNDSVNQKIRLVFNKSKLLPFYKSVLDSMPVIKIVPDGEKLTIIREIDTIEPAMSRETIEQRSDFVENIYPNPVIDYFVIEFNDLARFHIDLYNTGGRVLKSTEVNADRANINVKGIKPGIYFVRVLDVDSGEATIIKIILQ